MISIIAAVSDDLGIGYKNDLLWHIPEDLKRFRNLTIGNTVIMGKKTWESLPKRPLRDRRNIVLTDIPGEEFEGATAAYSLEDALAKCKGDKEIFIIGGGSVYHQFMNVADRLYITHVHKKAYADVYFPEINLRKWSATEKKECISEDEMKIPYSYVIYDRKKSGS